MSIRILRIKSQRWPAVIIMFAMSIILKKWRLVDSSEKWGNILFTCSNYMRIHVRVCTHVSPHIYKKSIDIPSWFRIDIPYICNRRTSMFAQKKNNHRAHEFPLISQDNARLCKKFNSQHHIKITRGQHSPISDFRIIPKRGAHRRVSIMHNYANCRGVFLPRK